MEKLRRGYPKDRGTLGRKRSVAMSVRLKRSDARLLESLLEDCDFGRSSALRRGIHALARQVWGRERYEEEWKDACREA